MRTQWRPSIVMLPVLTLVALACGGSPPNRAPSSEATGGAAAAKVTTAAVGDVVTFDNDSEWLITEAKFIGSTANPNNPFQEPLKTEGRFLQVKFSVKNLGSKELRVFSNPKLTDAKAREFKAIDLVAFYIPKGTKTLPLEGIGPGINRPFHAIYELPADAEDLTLEVWETQMPFGGATTNVALGI